MKRAKLPKLICLGVAMTLLFAPGTFAQKDYAYNAGKIKKTIRSATSDEYAANNDEGRKTLYEVLKELNRKRGVFFLFSDPQFQNQLVTPPEGADKKDVEKLLDKLLAATDLTFKKVSGNTFVIVPRKDKKPDLKPDANGGYPIIGVTNTITNVAEEISGKVTSNDGQPLPGVSVSVKGTNRGTTTNAGGDFSISAERGDILVFSYVGYTTQEVVVGTSTQISVTLQLSAGQVSEVVVTALGIRRESKRLGYSVSTVAGEGLTKARETNVANGLVGKVAGVNVSGVSGGPGSSSNVNIRGLSNFNGGSPLYVINGVPIDNSTRGNAGLWGGADLGDGIGNINPDDIEEITVLKGSTASALYGSRASNGVIVITTKSGKNRKGIGVEFNSNLVLDDVIDYTDFQYEYGQGLQGAKPVNQAAAYQSGAYSWGAKIDGSSVPQFDGVSRPYVAQKDNIKNFYKVGSTLTNTIAFSGGNDDVNFRLSASDLANEAVIPHATLDRNTFNFNLNSKVLKRLTLAAIINYVIEKSKNRPNLSDSPGNSNFGITFLPTTVNQEILKPGYNPDGSEINFNSNVYLTNPYFAAARFINNIGRNRLIANASLRYDFTNWLYLQGRILRDYSADRHTSVTPTGTAYYAAGNMNENSTNITELNYDFLLSADKKVTSDLGINVSIGGNVRKNNFEDHHSSGDQFVVPFLYVLNNTVNRNTDYQLIRRQTNSLYYTAEFSYKDMLYINTTGREDWFSTLPIDNNHLFYPSVSGSFVFSQLWTPSWLNFAKLRAAWANTSGETRPYQTQLYYSIAGNINGVPLGTISNSTIPNNQLQPFRLRELELGLEGRMLNNRLSFDLAWFNRKTIDEIVDVPASITSGYSGATLNFGEMENKGIEVLVSGSIVRSKNFNWSSSFNFTKLYNKIVKLAEGQSSQQKDQSRTLNAFIQHVVGKPASQVMAFDYKRDSKGDRVFDANGLPLQGDLIAMGSGFHDIYGGWSNDFTFKGFSLGVLIDYKYGGKIFSGTNAYATGNGLTKITLVGRETGIVGDGVNESGGANTANAKAWDYYGALQSRVSSEFVYDASFIKLRQVVLGYTLPAKLFTNTPIQGISVSLVGRNLAILKKHTPNFDPESNYTNGIAQGLELAGVPAYRSYGVNINVKF